MASLRGASVYVLGQIEGVSKEGLKSLVRRAGGRLAKKMTKRVSVIVAAHSAARPILTGSPLMEAIDQAPESADLVSERTFKRWLRLLPPLEAQDRQIPVDKFVAVTGLDPELMFWLELFDVIEAESQTFGWRDLVAAREVGRLLDEGADLVSLLETAVELKRDGLSLADSRLAIGPGGVLMRCLDGIFVRLDGQMLLPLTEPRFDLDDMVERAEIAEDSDDLETAERLLTTASAMDRLDPSLPFRLATVLWQRGDLARAAIAFQMAIVRDPDFPEAWFNLGVLSEDRERIPEAEYAYRTALEINPDFADALNNLGVLSFENGDFESCITCLERLLQQQELSPAEASGVRKMLMEARRQLHGGLPALRVVG